jgi:cytidylate kinase
MRKLPHDSALERILDRQMRLWDSARVQRSAPAEPPHPNLVISQPPGSGAEELAARLAQRLGWEIYDRRIVEALHDDHTLGKTVLESLDEHLLSYREDWLYHLFVPGHLSAPGYVQRLSRLVFSIAMRGRAIILGRGAGFVVPPEHRLAVLVVRSLESRLHRAQQEHGGTVAEARRALARRGRERSEFVLRSFHRDADDPLVYELCVNLDTLGLEAAEQVVLTALEARFPALRATAEST